MIRNGRVLASRGISACSTFSSRQTLAVRSSLFFSRPSTIVVLPKCFLSIDKSVGRPKNLLEIYETEVSNGTLHKDPRQFQAVRRLNRLQKALEGYSNESFITSWYESQTEWMKEMQREKEEEADKNNTLDPSKMDDASNGTAASDQSLPPKEPVGSPPDVVTTKPLPRIPRGLYLHGPVGTGKSMLMDLFYKQYPSSKRRREHFHAFLHDVHRRIHELRQADAKRKEETSSSSCLEDFLQDQYSTVERVAVQMASECHVLCLDEFHVIDVAEAYILSQVLEVMLSLGTVVVATSNQPPQNLSFVGQETFGSRTLFVDLLQQHCIVHDIESSTDYRQVLSSRDSDDNFYVLAEDGLQDPMAQIDALLQQFKKEHSIATRADDGINIKLDIGFGRHICVSDNLVGRFEFSDICRDNEWGTLEFRAIAKHHAVVVLENIPLLKTSVEENDENRSDHVQSNQKELDQARRFVLFLDELYEARTALLCSAAAPPQELFVATTSDDETTENRKQTPHERTVSTVKRDLPFAVRRAASRLTEMTSQQWWDRVIALRMNKDEDQEQGSI